VWKDQYNLDSRFARYRTRKHELPQLRAYYEDQVEEASAQKSHLLRDDSDALVSFVADVW
jgi:hypothetical protein